MYCKNSGKETGNGAGYRPGRGAAVPERPERKPGPARFRAALVLAAVMLALVLTGCGDGKNGKNRFSSPEEYYRHVESAAAADSIEQFGEGYDEAMRGFLDTSGRKAETETVLELFKPAQDMLETYTGYDFSWMETLGVSASVNLAEEGAAMELALALNGRDLIGMEVLADFAEGMLYGRVPLLSEEYFQTGSVSYDAGAFDVLEEMSEALPDGETVAGLLSRCVEAALEYAGDVKQGSDTLSAGGVSAKYTTLAVTLGEDDLRDMAKDVCKILKKDKDIEEYFLYLEDQTGTGLYDDFLDTLDELPDRIELDDDVVMTLYVDEDDVIRGRVIEYDDYTLRYAMPEDGGKLGLELSLEDDGEILWIVSGDGERDGDTLEGSFTVELEDTELFTVMFERTDADGGTPYGTCTIRPTYEYYTLLGMYSLTARALEDFSYTLNVKKDKAVFDVHMDGEPFLALTVRSESGPAEALPAVSGAKDITSWSRSLVLGGGLDYYNYLKESDLPPELLQRLFGAVF